MPTWEFPKIGGTLFWGPYNKDPTNSGTLLGSQFFGSSQIEEHEAFSKETSRVLVWFR